MSFELRLNLLMKSKQEIQELEHKHTIMVNKLSHELQLIGFADKERKIKKLMRVIQHKTRKLIESI